MKNHTQYGVKINWSSARASALHRNVKDFDENDRIRWDGYPRNISIPTLETQEHLDSLHFNRDEVLQIIRRSNRRVRLFIRFFDNLLLNPIRIKACMEHFVKRRNGNAMDNPTLLEWVEEFQYELHDDANRPNIQPPCNANVRSKDYNIMIAYSDLHIASFALDSIIDGDHYLLEASHG